MQHGLALRMKHELHALAARHRVPLPTGAHTEPPLPCCDGPMLLAGYASTFDIDFERTKFAPDSLRWLPWAKPLLFHRHVPVVIGTVDSLNYSDAGLRVVARTDHRLAKLTAAFSIGATIKSYVLRNADSPDFFAEVLVATLDEISLTSTPANPHALVHERMPASLHGPAYTVLVERIARLQQMVRAQMTKEQRA
jgi:hypothetical protein